MSSGVPTVAIDQQSLDLLMPFHLQLLRDGRISHAGPIFEKLRPGAPLAGQQFFDHFDVRRPARIVGVDGLFRLDGGEIRIRLRGEQATELKGVALKVGHGSALLLNLSFGISIVEAVRLYALAKSDFAPTDLAIEMLYLVEAKSAAMDESRRLNLRLNGARVAAEKRALTDTLTGLRNRRALDHAIQRLIAEGHTFALMQVDLDFFKEVNDSLGHAAGDHVLLNAGHILTEEVRALDMVTRSGGDEFVILFRGTLHPATLSTIAQRIIARLEEPIDFDGTPCRISASIGVTLSTHYAVPEAERMLRDADGALYRSKRAGRSRVTVVSCEEAEGERLDPPAQAPQQSDGQSGGGPLEAAGDG